jgi:hypothetical protein
MENKSEIYFSKEALQEMISVQGKIIDKIVIFLWQNLVDTNNSVEIIDALQLRFTDGTNITLGCNETSEALDILNYKFKDVKQHLEEEFSGKIKIHALDAGKTKMWEDIGGKTLNAIQLTNEDGNYKADAVLLDFGTEKRSISMSPYDGLVIDYYEED